METKFAKQPVAFLTMFREKTVNHEDSRTVRETEQVSKKKKEDRKRSRTEDDKVRESKKRADEKKDRWQMKYFSCGKMGHPAFMCKENGGLPVRRSTTSLRRMIIHTRRIPTTVMSVGLVVVASINRSRLK